MSVCITMHRLDVWLWRGTHRRVGGCGPNPETPLASPTRAHVFKLTAAAISCERRFTKVCKFDIVLLTSYKELRREPYRDSGTVFNSDRDRFSGNMNKDGDLNAENSDPGRYPDLN